MSQVIIGYTTEGTTDVSFLGSIIQRTFEWVAYECKGSIEVLPLINIPKRNGAYVDQVIQCCIDAYQQGVMIFCVHGDADANNDRDTFDNRINPLINALAYQTGAEICNNIVPVVPIQMTEAWMLADISLLKSEIGTDLKNSELGLHRVPETIADPKRTIEEAIRIAREHFVGRKRKSLRISDLYLPIGQKITLDKLDLLPSYRKFKEAVRQSYRAMNYL